MLIVEVKDSENLEKALRKFKKKFESTKVLKQLRARKEFVKDSVKRRAEIKKAIYVNKKYGQKD